ncbi:MAG TPA: 2-dehydropantoate 2-reductase N-terminal domain-containing protein [Candidatus Angelobacter sp.]
MKAVVIGAGRIGCGLAGELLRASGYEVTFVTRDPRVVENLNRNGRYHVLLTSSRQSRKVTVDQVKALAIADEAAVVEALAQAEVIVTSVCSQNMGAIAPLIARGLALRTSPSNVLAFENMPSAGGCLRRLVVSYLPEGSDPDLHGFSGVVISRAVTRRLGDPAAEQPLTFIGDTIEDFVVERSALRGAIPAIKGMKLVDNYQAWALRKLYTFSAGHATAAYLGWLKGYHYIHTAIRDKEIREAVLTAMREGQRGLAAKFGEEFGGSPAELNAIVARFENAAINDPIVRVARDPERKLGSEERLVGAALLAEEAGVIPEQLAVVTAAALCFSSSGQAGQCTACYENSRAAETLNRICGLNAAHGFGRTVVKSWAQLAPSILPGNLLLSLNQRMWARV